MPVRKRYVGQRFELGCCLNANHFVVSGTPTAVELPDVCWHELLPHGKARLTCDMCGVRSAKDTHSAISMALHAHVLVMQGLAEIYTSETHARI